MSVVEEEFLTLSVKEGLFVNNILTVCAKRGAFNVEEFKDIGDFHKNLKKKLEPHIEKEKEPQKES